MLTDTHCHLDFNKFDEDRAAVLERARAAGVTRMLIPGLDAESSTAAVELAEANPEIYAAVGFHPNDIEKLDQKGMKALHELAGHAKVVAIGEIGIDYYWETYREGRAWQVEAFRQLLDFAALVNKPVVVHMREEGDHWHGQASIDLLNILREWHRGLTAANHPLARKPGVLHSFNGTLETAQKALELNFYIGVTGPVTYKNAEEKRQIIKHLPLAKLLIETDSPFLTPVPHRGKRNEPAFVAYIADKIAEIHMTTRDQVAQTTAANAAHLFGWGG